MIPMLSISAIPAFTDNYIWLLQDRGGAVVVDPGDATPVLQALKERGLELRAILITHHHPDHTGGIAELLRQHPVPVYGPRAEAQKIAGLTHLLDAGDRVEVLGTLFEVMAVPGHTLGHIAYASRGMLFCGDTLFSAGCGRLFEGTPAQMHDSLTRLAALPGDTAVYCTHEYTLSNLAFARAVEPGNVDVAEQIERVQQQRSAGRPSLPSTLALERCINPFLRCGEKSVVRAVQAHAGSNARDAVAVFAALRQWKDGFRPAL